MQNQIYDIIIIGAGPAGMTAAIYAGRANKTVALVDKYGFGGNIANSPLVENIPGFMQITGLDFASNMFAQVEALDSVTTFVNEVILVQYQYGLFKIWFDDNTFIVSKSIIIATGTTHKKLNLDTNDIYYCATCDGPFFKNKTVFVVGSGNTGATYALDLAQYCKQVYLCDITMDMCCEQILKSRIEQTENIQWLSNTTIVEAKNNKKNKLDTVTLSTGEKIKCNAIFAAIGQTPQTKLFEIFTSQDKNGYIIANDCIVTKVPGVFAAGDCRSNGVKQVTTACSDGTIAAINAIKFLANIK